MSYTLALPYCILSFLRYNLPVPQEDSMKASVVEARLRTKLRESFQAREQNVLVVKFSLKYVTLEKTKTADVSSKPARKLSWGCWCLPASSFKANKYHIKSAYSYNLTWLCSSYKF